MTNTNSGNALEALTFSLNGQAFALEASYVREILDLVPVTEVPTSNPFARGLINVRGKIVPLADLRYKLGMEERPPTIDTRIVVIELDLDGDLTTIGLLAEKVHEVTSIAAAEMEETPKIGMIWRREYIRGVGKRDDDFIVVLDIAAIFSSALQKKQDLGGIHAGERHAA
ncbi:MAG: chemotaxis protein CheW [Rhodomicrobium sp.]